MAMWCALHYLRRERSANGRTIASPRASLRTIYFELAMMRRARATNALAAHLAKLSEMAPAEVPSAAPSCSRPGSVPEQSARTSEAADEEVKSPEVRTCA